MMSLTVLSLAVRHYDVYGDSLSLVQQYIVVGATCIELKHTFYIQRASCTVAYAVTL
jgi:hypothetical protein